MEFRELLLILFFCVLILITAHYEKKKNDKDWYWYMSVKKLYLIICDGCGETYASGDLKQLTAKMQRDEYVSDGWKYIHGKDYCQDCSDQK